MLSKLIHRFNKPDFVECSHKAARKYRLVVKDLETKKTTKKRLCSACVNADLNNNRIFVALY